MLYILVKYDACICMALYLCQSILQYHNYIYFSSSSILNSEPDDDSQFINFRESFMEFMDEIRD